VPINQNNADDQAGPAKFDGYLGEDDVKGYPSRARGKTEGQKDSLSRNQDRANTEVAGTSYGDGHAAGGKPSVRASAVD